MKRPQIRERRIILGLLGVPYLILGIGILRQEGSWQPLAPSVEYIAGSLFGWLWIIAGAYAIAAMLTSDKGHVIEEVGYGFLFIPPFIWMSAYLVTLIYGGGFLIFVGLVIASTITVLVLFLARYMRNRRR